MKDRRQSTTGHLTDFTYFDHKGNAIEKDPITTELEQELRKAVFQNPLVRLYEAPLVEILSDAKTLREWTVYSSRHPADNAPYVGLIKRDDENLKDHDTEQVEQILLRHELHTSWLLKIILNLVHHNKLLHEQLQNAMAKSLPSLIIGPGTAFKLGDSDKDAEKLADFVRYRMEKKEQPDG